MAPKITKVSKDELYKCLECPLCGRLCQKATTIVECLHTFCHKCITKRLEDGRENFCPECKVSLGHRPFEALRLDRQIADIRLKLFPDGLEVTCSRNVANDRFVNCQPQNLPASNTDLGQELHASKMRVAELEAALEAEQGWRISAEKEAGTLEHFWSKGCVLFHSLAGKGKFTHGAVSEARVVVRSLVALLDTKKMLEPGNQQGPLVRDVFHSMKNVDMLLEKVDWNGPPNHGNEEEIVNNFMLLEQQQQQQRQRQQQQQASCYRQRDLKVVHEKRSCQAFEAGGGTRVESMQKRRKVTTDVKDINQLNRHDTTRTGIDTIGHSLACHDKLGRRTPTRGCHLMKGNPKTVRKAREHANLPHAVRPSSKQANGQSMNPDRDSNEQCVNTKSHVLSSGLDIAQLADYQRVNLRRQRRRKIEDSYPVKTLIGELEAHTDADLLGSLEPKEILDHGKVEMLDVEKKETLEVKEETLELEKANLHVASQPLDVAVSGFKRTARRIKPQGTLSDITVRKSERCTQTEQAKAGLVQKDLPCKISKAEKASAKEELEDLRISSLHSVAILQDGSEHEVAFKRLKTKVVLPPVSRNSKGEGPPYVPDGWGWQVGRRSREGVWTDRYSWPPGIPRTYKNALKSDLDLLRYFRNTHPNETDSEVEALKARFQENWPWGLPACGSGCSGQSSSGDDCDISDVDWSCNDDCTEEETGLLVCPIPSGAQLCGSSAAGTAAGMELFCTNVTETLDNREKPVSAVKDEGVENCTSEGKKGEQYLWNDDTGEMVNDKGKNCNFRSIETNCAILPRLGSELMGVGPLTETQAVGHSFLGSRVVSGKRSVTRKRSSIVRGALCSKRGEISGSPQLPSSYVMAEEKGCEASSPIVIVSEDEDDDLKVPYVLALPAQAEDGFDEFIDQMMTVRMSVNRVLSSPSHNICVSATPQSVVCTGFENSGARHFGGNGSRLLDSSNMWDSTSLQSRSSGSENAKGGHRCENQASCLLVADSQSRVESANTTSVEALDAACGKVPIVETMTSTMPRQPCDGGAMQHEGIEIANVTFLHSGCTTGSLVRLPSGRDTSNCSGSCWKPSQECETSVLSSPCKGNGNDQLLHLQITGRIPCFAGVKEESSCPLLVYPAIVKIERPDLNSLPVPSPESQDGSSDPCNGSLLEREGRQIGDEVGVTGGPGNNLERDAWSLDKNGACSSVGQGLPFGSLIKCQEDFLLPNQSLMNGCTSEQRFQQPDLNEPALPLDLNAPSEGSPRESITPLAVSEGEPPKVMSILQNQFSKQDCKALPSKEKFAHSFEQPQVPAFSQLSTVPPTTSNSFCPSNQNCSRSHCGVETTFPVKVKLPSPSEALVPAPEDCSMSTGDHSEVPSLEQKPLIKALATVPCSSSFLAAFSATKVLDIPELKPLLVADLSHKTVSKKKEHDSHHIASEGAWRTHANAGHCSVKDVVASVGKELKLLGKDLLSTLNDSDSGSDLQTRSFTYQGQSIEPPLRFRGSGNGEGVRENSTTGMCRSRIRDKNFPSTEEQRNRMLDCSQLAAADSGVEAGIMFLLRNPSLEHARGLGSLGRCNQETVSTSQGYDNRHLQKEFIEQPLVKEDPGRHFGGEDTAPVDWPKV